MRFLCLTIGGSILPAALLAVPAAADPGAMTWKFAVLRNGAPIGTNTVELRRDGRETSVRIDTHIVVKIAFVPVYRFDQSETEHWVDGHLVAMKSQTDDNGTVHRVNAATSNNRITVEADGKVSEVAGTTIPASLWNPKLVEKTTALNPQDGSIMPIAIVDHGEESVVVQGRPAKAHHYSIRSTFNQDVWYDDQRQLIKVELLGSDGSVIQYQPG